MTEEQKKYYNAMKKLGSKKPQKPIPRPLVSALCGAQGRVRPHMEKDTARVTAEGGKGQMMGGLCPPILSSLSHPKDLRKGIRWPSSG